MNLLAKKIAEYNDLMREELKVRLIEHFESIGEIESVHKLKENGLPKTIAIHGSVYNKVDIVGVVFIQNPIIGKDKMIMDFQEPPKFHEGGLVTSEIKVDFCSDRILTKNLNNNCNFINKLT